MSLVANVLTGFCGGSRGMQQLDDPDSNLPSCVTRNRLIEVEGLKAVFCRKKSVKICEIYVCNLIRIFKPPNQNGCLLSHPIRVQSSHYSLV